MSTPKPLLLLLLTALCLVVPPTADADLLVSGSAVDEAGAPLPGATVALRPVASSYNWGLELLGGAPYVEPVVTVPVAEDGSFTLKVPAPGLWLVSVEAEGFVPVQHEPVAVLSSTELPPAILPSDAGSQVRVQDPAGRPLSGARVFAGSLDPELWQNLTPGPWGVRPRLAFTDEEGHASLPRPQGEHLAVGVVAPGRLPAHAGGLTEKPMALRLEEGLPRPLRVVTEEGEAASEVLVRVGKNALPIALTTADGTAQVVAPPEEAIEVRLLTPEGQRLDGTLPPVAADVDSGEPAFFRLPPPLRIAGRVLDARSHAPLIDVLVWPGHDPGLAVHTDGRGRYELPAVANPHFWLRAEKAGYLPRSQRLPLLQGQGTISRSLSLEPAARLAGRVTDREGNPIPAVDVLAVPRTDFTSGPFQEPPPQDRDQSDAQGRFLLKALRPGEEYELAAFREGFAPARTTVAGLAAFETRRDVHIVLDWGRRVVGRVEGGQGQPLAQVAVEILPSSKRRGRLFREVQDGPLTARTDRAGRYSIPHVPTGLVDLRFSREGLAPLSRRGVEVSPGRGQERGPRDLGTVTMLPGQALHGRVMEPEGAPLPDAEVVMLESDRLLSLAAAGVPLDEPPAATTNADGHFDIQDLPAEHRMHLLIRRPGYHSSRIEGVAAPTAEPLQIVLEPASQLSGEVVDEEGEPVPGARIHALGQDPVAAAVTSHRAFLNRTARGTTDSQGHFDLEGLSPGLVELSVSAEGYLPASPRDFRIPQGENLMGVRIGLRRGATLEGRVTTEDGEPVQGARLRAAPATGITDADGYYLAEGLPEGTRTVVVDHPAHPEHRETVEIHPRINVLDVVLDEGQTVIGRVADATGAGLEGVRVYLLQVADDPYGAVSAEDGSFQFPAVRPGEYTLQGEKEGYAPTKSARQVVVDREPVRDLVLAMEEGGNVTGRLLGLDLDELAGVEVFAQRQEGGRRYGRVHSDGTYELDHLEHGVWEIRGVLPGSSRQATARRNLEEGQDRVEADLDFTAGLNLEGRVKYADAPLAGARVSARGVDLAVSRETLTDYQGHFSLAGLEAGTYRLQVVQRDEHINHSQDLQLNNDREILVEIDSAVVRGRVVDAATGESLPSALVAFERMSQASAEAAFLVAIHSEADGAFALPRVTAGTYRVKAQKEGYVPTEELLELAPGITHQELELVLTPGSGLELAVRLDTGQVPRRATVAVLTDSDGIVVVESQNLDPEGRARFRNLRQGTWDLLVTAPDAAPAIVRATIPGEPRRVVLARASRLTVIVPELAESSRVGRLSLRDTSGRPFHKLDGSRSFRESWPVVTGRTTVTNLPPGPWQVVVTGPSGRRWEGAVTTIPGGETHLRLGGR